MAVLAVEPVLVDAGDQRLLLLEDRLLLDERGERQDLVEAHVPLGRDRHPVADGILEPVEHEPDELVGGGVGQDAVRGRPEVALERRALGQLEPRVVGEELRRRMLGQLVEVGRVHRQAVDRLELGRDLLEPQARPQRDVDVRVRGRVQQRRDELVRGHRLAEDEVAGLQLVGEAALDGDQDERPSIREEPLVLEAGRDRGGRLAGADLERNLLGVVRRGHGELVAEVVADHVGDERDAERTRVVGRPSDDRALDDRAEHGDEGDQHDRGQDEGEGEEPDDAARAAARAAPAPTVAAVAVPVAVVRVRVRSRAPMARRTSPCSAGCAWGCACRVSRGRPPERIVIGCSPYRGLSAGSRTRGQPRRRHRRPHWWPLIVRRARPAG